MKETAENVKEHVDGKDEFGIDRSKFIVGKGTGNSDFFKLKDGQKAEISIVKGGVRQVDKEFKKFSNGKPVVDEQGEDVIERTGPALEVDVDRVDGTPVQLKWEVTAKKLTNLIFSFLDKREKDGTPYLFSRLFQVERKGAGKDTTYVLFPTEPKTSPAAPAKGQQALAK